jgi:excisionase family DNA binding protein
VNAERKLLTMNEVAQELAVSLRTVKNLVAAGGADRLPSMKIRGCRRVRRHDLERWLRLREKG